MGLTKTTPILLKDWPNDEGWEIMGCSGTIEKGKA